MYAQLVVDGTKASVNVYVDDECYCTKSFPSVLAAEAALSHAGWRQEHEHYWVVGWLSEKYKAVSSLSRELRRSHAVFDKVPELRMVVRDTLYGYGFSFCFDGIIANDPIVHLLTTGMVKVDCIGEWSTIRTAADAGVAFFERVRHLFGDDMLAMMLYVVKGKPR
jgi:hypothetical protein